MNFKFEKGSKKNFGEDVDTQMYVFSNQHSNRLGGKKFLSRIRDR